MSDLISRSKLLKEIETWGGCVEALNEYIEKMPTAYDIDKVIDEMEQLKNKGSVTKTEKLITNACVNKAIEIVKQGVVADDVCEWKDNYSNNQYSYLTSCDKIFEFDSDYNFCPYCGKKIKVVE